VSAGGPPVLEPRSADGFAATLRGRLPAYVPGWQPQAGGPGDALLLIYGRFLDALGERIDRTPDKNELAFLDLLGLDLLPAQAARAPVAFATSPQLGDARAPAGTRLAAKAPDGGDPIVFETETEIALAAARIAEVVTVWPARDAYADHSAEAIGGRPFTLWEPLQPIRHELYLAHPLHLALAGRATVELDVELAGNGSAPLSLVWQYWDGDLWRDFKPQEVGDDGSAGLTRSGAVTLRSDCAQAKPTTVGGVKSFWLRGSLADPLPPDASRTLPRVDRIALRTVLERKVDPSGVGGLLPDTAFAGSSMLDLTKPFQPFGQAPNPETSFYVACEEAFSRPGAAVKIVIDRQYTAQEKNDIALAKYEVGINEAKARLDQIKAVAAALDAVLKALVDPATGDLRADATPLFDPNVPEQWYTDVHDRVQNAYSAARGVAQSAQMVEISDAALATGLAIYDLVPGPNPFDPFGLAKEVAGEVLGGLAHIPIAAIAVCSAQVIVALAEVAKQLSSGDANREQHLTKLKNDLANIQNDVNTLADPNASASDKGSAAVNVLGSLGSLGPDWLQVASDLGGWPSSIFLDANLPGFFQTARDRYAEARRRIDDARTAIQGALTSSGSLIDLLDKLTPEIAAAAAGVVKPKLPKATLAWEYWDGSAWKRLPELTSVAPDGSPSKGPRNLRHGRGEVTFTAPHDWETTKVNNVVARWLRLRIVDGAFAIVKLVSWFDTQSQTINYLAISDPRPPQLDLFKVGYRWVSDPSPPERCLTLNDFQWSDRTDEASWRGSAFAPFVPTDDLVPALYLGFDRPLPADLVGLFLDIAEVPGDTAGPPLEWQYWDGSGWGRVSVEDETADLALPGAVRALWPGTDPLPEAPIAAASDAAVQVADARAAAAFAPSDLLWVSQGKSGELATVDAVAGDTIALRAPLAGSYARGTVARAGLPRFGVPRTWLRARLRTDGDPRRSTVSGLYSNAVWAAQIQTIRDELLGSSNGQPRQTFFFTRSPVLRGETLEVRELEGPAAAVEYPLLVDELARAGIRETDLRTVTSPQTGKISEVWVPWRERPSLLFSGPDDRDYALERNHGRLIFGDGVNGRIPPAGSNSIRARTYRSGGGTAGNVLAGAISQALSGVVVQSVSNPLPGEGGAEGEPDEAVLGRGPLTLRNWRQALSADDYEALAREASPAVALARALPMTGPSGRRGPGWVTVVVVPRSPAAEPQPSYELRREVRSFLLARTPAALAGRLAVVGPSYLRVGVEAVVAPKRLEQGGAVAEAARAALAAFLHPLTGGPDGTGWGSRREVCLSDVAALFEPLDGVDYVERLLLVDRGVPTGDVLSVPADRLVAAGPVTVQLTGQEA
jgi:predicted phage baseplate assembly protein